jgi:predicted transcriptional regulator
LSPAVPVSRSVTPDAVICLECGARQKTLRRHLSAAHDLSPEEYRARWNLPADYPLVAPEYAKRRSELALESGLGGKRPPEATVTAPAKPGFHYPASRWSKPNK